MALGSKKLGKKTLRFINKMAAASGWNLSKLLTLNDRDYRVEKFLICVLTYLKRSLNTIFHSCTGLMSCGKKSGRLTYPFSILLTGKSALTKHNSNMEDPDIHHSEHGGHGTNCMRRAHEDWVGAQRWLQEGVG
jgi:hypothetical protein